MMTKKELKDVNLWEITGRLTATFALMGALGGPAVLASVNHVMSHDAGQPVKELTAKNLATMSIMGAKDGAASGLLVSAIAIPLLWHQRKKAIKEQTPSAQ